MKNGVIVRAEKRKGRTAYATRAFEAGDIVLTDEATMTFRKCDVPPSIIKLAQRYNLESDYWAAVFAASALSIDVLEAVWNDLYSPVGKELRLSQPELKCAAEFLGNEAHFSLLSTSNSAAFWIQLCQEPDAANKLCSFVHACRINCHSDAPKQQSHIFLLGSKFSHSCCPNCYWRLQVDGEKTLGVHIAVRSIKAGEELSFGYTGTGWDALSPTPIRREALLILNFVCYCSRCVLFDKGNEASHDIKCFECDRRRVRLSARGTWTCLSCRNSLNSSNVISQLHLVAAVRARVMRTFFRNAAPICTVSHPALDEVASIANPLLMRLSLASLSIELLGENHYLAAVAACGLVRSLIIGWTLPSEKAFVDEVMTSAPPFEWVSTLHRIITTADSWFVKNADGGPQHQQFRALVDELAGHIAPQIADTDASQKVALMAATSRTEDLVRLRRHEEFFPLSR